MMRKVATIIIIVIFAIVGLYYFSTNSSDNSTKNSVKSVEREMKLLGWSSGLKRVYNFKTNSNIEIFLNGHIKNETVTMLSKWNIRVVKQRGEHLLSLMQLSNISLNTSDKRLSATLKEIYSKLFIVEFDKKGSVINSYFDCSKEDSKGLREMLKSLEIVVEKRESYQVIEHNIEGDIEVDYQRDPQNPSHLIKHRNRYITQNSDKEIKIAESKIDVTLDNEWIEQLSSFERLNYFVNGSRLLSTVNEVSFKLEHGSIDENLEIWKFKGDIEQLIASYNKKEKKNYLKEMKKEAQKAYFKEKKITLTTLFQKMRPDNIQSMLELEAYLKLYPKETEKMYQKIKEVDDYLGASLINVLGRVGTAEAQDILRSLIEDEEFNHRGKLQSIMALGSLTSPQEETVDFMWSIYNQRDDHLTKDLSNTMLLSLGALSRNKEVQEGVVTQLKDIYQSEKKDNEIRRVALLSMGNSDTKAFKREIFDALEESDNKIKATAIRVLKGIDSSEVKEKLNQLSNEKHSRDVRLALSRTILALTPTQSLIETSKKNLFKEGDSLVRKNIILYLLKNREAYPQNNETLKEFRSLEKDRSNQLILIQNGF